MNLIRLSVKGISYSQTGQGAYALILAEEEGNRKLPIVIGAAEAQSIAIAIEEDLKPPRPLTHDLLKTCFDRFHIQIKEVIIHKLQDGIFYSSLVCTRSDHEEIIDARTSDAVALAVRTKAPIYTYSHLLDSAGIELQDSTEITSASSKKTSSKTEEPTSKEVRATKQAATSHYPQFKGYSEKQLQAALKKAVEDEDYEKAAAIRDELEKRNL